MAISSANFQKAKSNSVAETTREFEAKYLLPKEHRGKNEFYNCGVDEKILFNQEVAKAERKGGRIPKLENSLWEGVINLNKKHTIEDVNRVGEHIAKKFNLHYTRGALHRDEGHIDEKGKVQYNYHAHINFMTYKDGKQNWRLEFVNKEALREIQTEVAELLGMDRGELNSKSVRANHRHFRVNAEEIKAERIAVKETNKLKEEKTILKKENSSLKGQNTKSKNEKEKLKEELQKLKDESKDLRAELQLQKAEKEAYQQLDYLNKQLQEQLKTGRKSFEEAKKEIEDLREKLIKKEEDFKEIEDLKKEKEHLISIIEVKEIDLVELKNQNKSLQEQKTVLADKVTDLEEKINSRPNMSEFSITKELQNIVNEELEEKEIKTGLFSSEKAPVIVNQKSFLKKLQEIATKGTQLFQEKYSELKEKYNDLVSKFKDLQKENAVLKAELEELKERSSTKQIEKENLNILKSLQSEAKRDGLDTRESEALFNKNQEEKTEEISSKKRGFGRSR